MCNLYIKCFFIQGVKVLTVEGSDSSNSGRRVLYEIGLLLTEFKGVTRVV